MPGVNVAEAALAAGVPQVALNVARGVLSKEPHNTAALLSEADALAALGRQAEADASYAKLLTVVPDSVPALIGLGRIRLRQDPAQAQTLFLSALQREPRNTIALNDLGVALDLQGDHEGAQASYRRVLGLDSRSRAAQVNLALSMALSGHAVEAVEMLRPFAFEPDAAPRVRHDLAAAMVLAGDAATAARLLGRDMTPEQVDRAVRAYQALVP
jgi:Flp pilus assembly protein TadD